MFALGTTSLSAASYHVAGSGGAPALPAINAILIEGDSITSNAPSTYAADFYSYQYDDHRPDKAVEVRAQNSRSVGVESNQLPDDRRSLSGRSMT